MNQVDIEKLRHKRVIFTVTSGRSGTLHLANILNVFSGVTSLHEPEPNFASVMRAAQSNSSVAKEFWLQEKLPVISAIRSPIYIETSHVFCKGFLEPLLSIGISPELIFLHRNARDVALSLYQLNTIPARTELGLQWLLSPDDPNVVPLGDYSGLHDYQLCYWYCLEIERRQTQYAALAATRNLRTVHLGFDELIRSGARKTIRKALDLPAYDLVRLFKRRAWRQVKKNDKQHQKVRPNNLSTDELSCMESAVTSRFVFSQNSH